MVRSMTGFGKATCELDGALVSVELSSVNHRYLDQSLRIPYEWAVLEPVIRETVKKALSRGKINITVSRKRGSASPQTLRFDSDLARQYVDASKDLGSMLGSGEALTLTTLAQLEGVFFHAEKDEDLEEVEEVLTKALDQALGNLDTMRLREGEGLHQDVLERVGLIRASVAMVEERLPELIRMYAERLKERIEELGADLSLTEDRVGLEVALMAEKGDVTEEVVRLKNHLDHAAELLESDEPVGRKLNFLSQEIQREINTLGAKVRDSDVSREVLEMKSELEKIREQIQNVE